MQRIDEKRRLDWTLSLYWILGSLLTLLTSHRHYDAMDVFRCRSRVCAFKAAQGARLCRTPARSCAAVAVTPGTARLPSACARRAASMTPPCWRRPSEARGGRHPPPPPPTWVSAAASSCTVASSPGAGAWRRSPAACATTARRGSSRPKPSAHCCAAMDAAITAARARDASHRLARDCGHRDDILLKVRASSTKAWRARAVVKGSRAHPRRRDLGRGAALRGLRESRAAPHAALLEADTRGGGQRLLLAGQVVVDAGCGTVRVSRPMQRL